MEELHTLSCQRTDFNRFTTNCSVLDSLVRRGLTPHVAWRVSFVTVPFVIVVFMAMMILFLAPDTPTGKWQDRHLNESTVLAGLQTPPSATGHVVDIDQYKLDTIADVSQPSVSAELEKGDLNKEVRRGSALYDKADIKFAEAALIKTPTITDVMKVAFSLTTIVQCACYFVTFGGELAINSNLSSFYIEASGTPAWSQTLAANWAAMYGLLNVVTRPLGGYIADCLYPVVGVEGKKYWMLLCIPYVKHGANHQVLQFRESSLYALERHPTLASTP